MVTNGKNCIIKEKTYFFIFRNMIDSKIPTILKIGVQINKMHDDNKSI